MVHPNPVLGGKWGFHMDFQVDFYHFQVISVEVISFLTCSKGKNKKKQKKTKKKALLTTMDIHSTMILLYILCFTASHKPTCIVQWFSILESMARGPYAVRERHTWTKWKTIVLRGFGLWVAVNKVCYSKWHRAMDSQGGKWCLPYFWLTVMDSHSGKYRYVTEAHRENQGGHCERSEHGHPGFRGGPQCSIERGVSIGASRFLPFLP